jgi:hypothetical protein
MNNVLAYDFYCYVAFLYYHQYHTIMTNKHKPSGKEETRLKKKAGSHTSGPNMDVMSKSSHQPLMNRDDKQYSASEDADFDIEEDDDRSQNARNRKD